MKATVASMVALLLAGCGTSPSSVTDWVGNWVASGTEVESCSSGNNTTQLTGAVAIVTFGAGSITTEPVNNCDLNWTVNGSVATLVGSTQTCTVPGSQGGSWHPTFTSGTLTLNAGSISITDSGTAVLAINNTTVDCTFSQSGLLTHN